MMKVFLDTNIVIDLLDKREPFYIDAIKLFTSKNVPEKNIRFVARIDF